MLYFIYKWKKKIDYCNNIVIIFYKKKKNKIKRITGKIFNYKS